MTYPQSVRDWCDRHDRCAVCHCSLSRCWPPASVHHLVKRSRKVCHEIWNLLPICGADHEGAIHGMKRPGFPSLTFGQLLGCKFEMDPEHWNPDALEELYGRRLPHVMPLPQEYLDERKLHRRYGG